MTLNIAPEIAASPGNGLVIPTGWPVSTPLRPAIEREGAPCSYTNPVIDADFPDPAVLRLGDTYYAYATNGAGRHVQVATSTDLVHWNLQYEDALPELPAWASTRWGYTWSPEVAHIDGRFVMYYVTRYSYGSRGTQAMGLAVSDSPCGPFRPVGSEPFICQLDAGGTIDPYPFVDDDGTRYLLWKNDGNSCGKRTWLYLQRMTPDGLSLIGEAHRLLTNSEPWEGCLVEAPTLCKHDGRYYLFYSANCYADERYAMGYAVSDTLTGPYHKPSAEPWIATDREMENIGPGGQSVVTGPAGDTWLVYHAWTRGAYRHMSLGRIDWQHGRPVLEGLGSSPHPAPAMGVSEPARLRFGETQPA